MFQMAESILTVDDPLLDMSISSFARTLTNLCSERVSVDYYAMFGN